MSSSSIGEESNAQHFEIRASDLVTFNRCASFPANATASMNAQRATLVTTARTATQAAQSAGSFTNRTD